jgi:GTP cyclohydrolase I
MVVVSGLPTWSLCEHHLLPFSATISVGYIPRPPDKNGEILGLSKVARVVHLCAHKLGTQERLVDDIVKMLEDLLKDPLGIAVVASGVHTCMTMRGIRTPGVMTTSKVTGVFRRQEEVRAEFFALINHGKDFGQW